MPVLIVWLVILLLPGLLVLTIAVRLIRPLVRRFQAWRTDTMRQRVVCEGCSKTIIPGRTPVLYGRCAQCISAGTRLKRVA